VTGGALNSPPALRSSGNAALDCPLATEPPNVYQRCLSAPPAAAWSKVNQLPCRKPVPAPTASAKTSTSMPWPLVAGWYHEPVKPCWFRSGNAAPPVPPAPVTEYENEPEIPKALSTNRNSAARGPSARGVNVTVAAHVASRANVSPARDAIIAGASRNSVKRCVSLTHA